MESKGSCLGMAIAALVILALIVGFTSCSVVGPGHRGVIVTLGKVAPTAAPEGVVAHWPFVTKVVRIPVRQVSIEATAPCFSSDLQQVNAQVRLLLRYPEANVVAIYRDYQGSVNDLVVAPKMQEALKEVTATLSAEQIVKQRELVKMKALDTLRAKLAGLVIVDDLVIENIDLTEQLEQAIEQKMVQEQEAAKAKFIKARAEIDAETAIIRAKGEAEAIRIRAQALADNPAVIELAIVEKWDGKAPLYVGGVSGAQMILPARGPQP